MCLFPEFIAEVLDKFRDPDVLAPGVDRPPDIRLVHQLHCIVIVDQEVVFLVPGQRIDPPVCIGKIRVGRTVPVPDDISDARVDFPAS